MLHALAPLIVALQLLSIHADSVALFTALEYRYTGGAYRDEVFRYRLFIPATGSPDARMPLIVWLHGRGESGADNVEQLQWLDQLFFTRPWKRERYPFYFLTVQCPEDNDFWTLKNGAQGDDMVNVVKAILDETLQDYPIDRARVCLAGLSSGGTGCWELARRYPQYFAAVAPLASEGEQKATIARLAQVPVWAFHCARDEGTPIAQVRTTVKALKQSGGIVHLTEVEADGHDCWSTAFADYHLLDWLLAQRRGQPGPQPGSITLGSRLAHFAKTWQWWEAIVQMAIVASLVGVTWCVIRTRHSRSKIPKAPAGL